MPEFEVVLRVTQLDRYRVTAPNIHEVPDVMLNYPGQVHKLSEGDHVIREDIEYIDYYVED